MGHDVFVAVTGLLLLLGFIQVNALFLIWLERKVAGHIQLRPGPMEVGPHGLLQTLVDGIKLMGKELITPTAVDKPMYWLAPIIVLIPAVVCFVVIPFAPVLQVRDIDVGILLIFSFSSLTVLAILMGGWASNNKYSLIGAARSVAQIIAYEIPLLLSTMSVIIMTNSFRMSDIIAAQDKVWFILFQPIAAIIFLIGATAETNRAPFDLPEAESELVAGFHTEYTGMRFALFFLAEYSNMFITAAMAVVLFFGGWQGPVLPGLIWFMLKCYALIFGVIWVRWTYPRLRFDQLMNFAWKILIPIALLNLMLTAIIIKLIKML
ncbi:MAG: NADH-quinone oxidoreductase subunit NuoH [Deltaproteobacteria bacterium]|nr:NADH-quinone oxidoreductase subunit NuoH [Deltaproteobacteria bacterium]